MSIDTINDLPPRAQYTASASQTVFPYPFPIFQDADLVVEVDGAVQTLTTHYTVSGEGEDTGGNVTFVTGRTAGQIVTIYRQTVIERDSDFQLNGPMFSTSVNDEFDKLTIIAQELRAAIKRCLRIPQSAEVADADTELTPISNWASKYMSFDADGKPTPAVLTSGTITGPIIGELLFPRTAAELAAAVVPSNYQKQPLQTKQRQTDRYSSIASALTLLQNGDVTEPVYYLEDWGAPCDGVQDDAPALNALIDALYAIDIHPTSNSRRAMPVIQLPARDMRFDSEVDVGNAAGTMGLTIRGCGAWATKIGVGASGFISGFGASNIKWADVAFVGDDIDDDVRLFRVTTASGGALRRWTFDHVDFFGIWKCFQTGGAALVDEFKFIGCHFLECYHLVENNNDQSVNWNFYACDWESTLDGNTAKNVDDAALFKLLKGMLVNWWGGSLIFHGKLVLLETTSSNLFVGASHGMNFDGVRFELMDNAGTHTSLVTRTASGYANVNALKFSLQNFTLIGRGTLPATLSLFDLRDNWTLHIRNGETEGCKVTGYFTSSTSTQAGTCVIDNVIGVTYVEDTTSRTNTHVQHNVTLNPNNAADRTTVAMTVRSGGTTGVRYTIPQRLAVRDNDGNLPQGGTTVNLPQFPNHSAITHMILQKFSTSAQSLTVELRDQADTTTYATATLGASANPQTTTAVVAREIGFQIGTESVPVPLMLKFVGTPETVKGVVCLEFM
jgi:hypothetical protein